VWVTAIVDGKIAALKHEITEALGEVIAQERATAKALIAAALGEVRTAIASNSADVTGMLDRHLAKFEALMAKLEQNDAALDRLAWLDPRQLPN
jgi:hypothetical protein